MTINHQVECLRLLGKLAEVADYNDKGQKPEINTHGFVKVVFNLKDCEIAREVIHHISKQIRTRRLEKMQVELM